MDEQKIRVWQTVSNAIQRNKIPRDPCWVCGDTKSQAHHEDYDKPFKIIWLCKRHHMHLHHAQKTRQAERAQARTLHMLGHTYQHIAETLGVQRSTVYKWVNNPNYR